MWEKIKAKKWHLLVVLGMVLYVLGAVLSGDMAPTAGIEQVIRLFVAFFSSDTGGMEPPRPEFGM